jgi:hypothetical protein
MPSRLPNAAAAALIAAATTVATASPAHAYPQPRPEEWWLGDEGYHAQSVLWPYSTGSNVIVGLIDSGVNASLQELSTVTLPGSDLDGGDDRTDTDTEQGGHGTAMAALIAGQGGGVGQMVGLAPGAKILPVQQKADWSDGLRWTVDHGAKVVNMSFGAAAEDAVDHWGCSADMMSAISYAIKKDVVLVAGAGNSGKVDDYAQEPAMCPGVLAVGGFDKDSFEWSKSNPGYYVSVGAPAVDVGSIGKDGTFGSSNGTSQAAALVSAMVALIRSKFPKMSGREVVRELIDTAQSLAKNGGWDPWTGYGGVRPRLVLQGHVPASGPNPVYERFDQWKASGSASAPVLGPPSSGPMPSIPPAPGSTPQPHGAAASGKKSVAVSDNKKSSEMPLIITVAAVVVLVAAGLGGLFVLRRKRSGAALYNMNTR